MIISKVFVSFSGSSKGNLYCILRDRSNNLRTVLVSQNTLKNTGPRAGTKHKQLRPVAILELKKWGKGTAGPRKKCGGQHKCRS